MRESLLTERGVESWPNSESIQVGYNSFIATDDISLQRKDTFNTVYKLRRQRRRIRASGAEFGLTLFCRITKLSHAFEISKFRIVMGFWCCWKKLVVNECLDCGWINFLPSFRQTTFYVHVTRCIYTIQVWIYLGDLAALKKKKTKKSKAIFNISVCRFEDTANRTSIHRT